MSAPAGLRLIGEQNHTQGQNVEFAIISSPTKGADSEEQGESAHASGSSQWYFLPASSVLINHAPRFTNFPSRHDRQRRNRKQYLKKRRCEGEIKQLNIYSKKKNIIK